MWGLLLGFAGKHKQLLFEALAVIGAVLLLWGWAARHYHDKYQPEIDAAHTERDNALEQVRLARQDQVIANKASKGYQDELAKLHEVAAATPAPIVRCVRRKPSQAGPVPDADSAGGSGGAAPGTGPLPQTDGPDHDIGAPLFALADQCDALSAQLRGLQGWVNEQIAARNGGPAP